MFRNVEGIDTAAFCPKSPDYRHQPDPVSIKPADGAGRNGTDWIVDVNCWYCGHSAPSASTPRESSSSGSVNLSNGSAPSPTGSSPESR